MRTEQIGFLGGIPLGESFVGARRYGPPGFPAAARSPACVQEDRDLVFGERVAFDCKRPPNGADAIDLPQAQVLADRRFLRRPIASPIRMDRSRIAGVIV